MKLIIFFLLLYSLLSCQQVTKSRGQNESIVENNKQDTIIIKHKNTLNQSYELGFYSKSYTYYWVVGKDTLDFSLCATEYTSDSTLHISVHHKKPILFATALKNINECFFFIKEDFIVSKFSSIYFKSPIYYLDLTQQISGAYEQKFGRKRVNHTDLNQFLLKSDITKQLNHFLSTKNRKVLRYSIEKFHLIEKKQGSSYLSNKELKEYPELMIEGMGMSILLEPNG